MKRVKQLLIIILATAISIIIPLISTYTVEFIGFYLYGNSLMRRLVIGIVFYIVQTGLSILFVRFVLGHSISDMGFNMKNRKTTVHLVKRFLLIWLILDILFYFVCINFVSGFDTYISQYYVKDTNMLLKDFISGCLLAGLGEEPLFRGLIVLMLSPIIIGQINIGKFKLPIVALFSGVLFMIAHIVYDITPFVIMRIDFLQLLFTFILGTTWASIFMKTKSLLGPILAHSLANTIQIMSGYFVAYFIYK